MPATATAVRNINRLPSEEVLAHGVEMRTNRQIRRLEVHCDGPRVRLIGESRSYYLKQLAQETIMPVRGELALVNQVNVINS